MIEPMFAKTAGILWTTREYPCGCKACGSGDVPAYCGKHGNPPNVGLRAAVKPFADLVLTTSGRIPYERLSAAHWHHLVKAYLAD